MCIRDRGIAAYMAGGFGGLASEVQAMYSMGLCYFPLSIGCLLYTSRCV